MWHIVVLKIVSYIMLLLQAWCRRSETVLSKIMCCISHHIAVWCIMLYCATYHVLCRTHWHATDCVLYITDLLLTWCYTSHKLATQIMGLCVIYCTEFATDNVLICSVLPWSVDMEYKRTTLWKMSFKFIYGNTYPQASPLVPDCPGLVRLMKQVRWSLTS